MVLDAVLTDIERGSVVLDIFSSQFWPVVLNNIRGSVVLDIFSSQFR